MERIEGLITDIVFQNEDNGYTIAKLTNEDGEISIVGSMPTLSVVKLLKLKKNRKDIRYYGNQFEVIGLMPCYTNILLKELGYT